MGIEPPGVNLLYSIHEPDLPDVPLGLLPAPMCSENRVSEPLTRGEPFLDASIGAEFPPCMIQSVVSFAGGTILPKYGYRSFNRNKLDL